MTRTTIITADGTRLTPEGHSRTLLRRAMIILAAIMGALIISAALIGFIKAATAPAITNRPSAEEFAILHNAERAGGKNCRLEWNEIQNAHEVICDR